MHEKAANARYFFCLWAVGVLGLLTAPLWAADRPSRAAIRSTVEADAAAIAPVQADEPAAPQNAAPQANAGEPTAAPALLPVLRPYAVATQRSTMTDLAAVSASSGSFRMLDQAGPKVRMALPMPAGDDLELELERFEVLGPEARFVRAGWNGEIAEPAPRLVLLRGHVSGDPESLAVITMTPEGSSSGFIRRVDAPPVTVYPAGGPRARGGELRVQVGGGSAFPETSEICGVHGGPPLDALLHVQEDDVPARIDRRMRIVNVAVDGDREFVDLFGGDIRAAESYVVQLVATVGEIYRRDLSVKLRLDFMRLWPEGGEPFRADDINSLYRVWFFSGNADRYRVHHLLSGRRDLDYGGVGFADDICGPNGYSISGLLLGSFATPPPLSDLGNWDLYVFGHEVGHNLGTYHTHDGYSPPIDNCPAGEFARGTIMSYCHTTAGGLLNVDLRFHRRVQEYLQFYLRRPCLPRDCNDNGLVDRDEILSGLGVDANGNNTLDECEDCNGNGTRDDLEIAAGAVDADENGIPDSCEPDCNSNGIPDPGEVKDDIDVVDINGNSIPDECEVDCNRNGIADHIDIAAEPRRDLDRDGILDLCQDCDGNRRADWADIQKAHCIYVADSSGRVMEYHPTSGVAVRSYGGGTLVDPQNIVVGPDRALYVTDFVVDGRRCAALPPGTGRFACARTRSRRRHRSRPARSTWRRHPVGDQQARRALAWRHGACLRSRWSLVGRRLWRQSHRRVQRAFVQLPSRSRAAPVRWSSRPAGPAPRPGRTALRGGRHQRRAALFRGYRRVS
jgi:hypothetical protein